MPTQPKPNTLAEYPDNQSDSIPEGQQWWVYLVRCNDGTLYTGITTDLARRLRQHNGELAGGARYTRSRRPVHLAWCCTCNTRSEASREEYRVRRLSPERKLVLLKQGT
ncbi:GIY-YIG nuclease family protein [Natronospirillum operosum]|uniref:GIY-YIG nuclease family protein n=1 Tax=Natronospirillum operosum TaxID=2759953 RepID=A0A4Z0W3M3_9GAMM|nr:GIY-YIG nuclease family protein [Natronospirillum operosum]TGG91322.1 GIY-YIG nuclease family protein [Natronospirillum operosum]